MNLRNISSHLLLLHRELLGGPPPAIVAVVLMCDHIIAAQTMWLVVAFKQFIEYDNVVMRGGSCWYKFSGYMCDVTVSQIMYAVNVVRE